MPLRDPATGLSCVETPLQIPTTLKPSDLARCSSCTIDFSAPNAGPKSLNTRSGNDGIGVDESPLASITINGTNYALYDTVLWKVAAHRGFNSDPSYDMEMNLYFRSIYDSTKIIAVAIPIIINNSKSMGYFNELANQNSTKRTFTLESIVSKDQPVLMYKGMDLRGRSAAAPVAAPQCNDIQASMTWYIFGHAFIASTDASRIREINFASNVLPPVPSTISTLERVRAMSMIIPKITIRSATALTGARASSENMILTRALQCQRINPSKDVKGDAVYLKGPPEGTLADEMDKSAALDESLDTLTGEVGTRARSIEDTLAIIIGVALGIVLFSTVAYFLLTRVYKNFVPTVLNELKTIPAITTAKEKACAAFVGAAATATKLNAK